MKTCKKYIAALMIAAIPALTVAQETYSGYFVDGYAYRFRMNPAFGNDSTSFVSIPGVGNANVAARGNLHVKDVFYNVDGRTTTFLNPGVSASELMSNLSNNNRVGADINITVLAGGFKAWGGYNTVSINGHGMVNLRAPKELFRLLKEGVKNDTYDISNLSAQATGYAEMAFGHSRQINKQWRVGGTFKMLFGIGNMDAQLKNATLNLDPNGWVIQSDAMVRTNFKNAKYKTDINKDTGHEYVSGIDLDGAGMTGFGIGFDLGAVYTLNSDWEFSASLLDLGFIHWSDNILATTDGVKEFTTDRYTFNVDKDADNSFDNEWKRMKNSLTSLYELDNAGNTGGRTTGLAATLNLAAQYTLPVYRNLNFGLVNTTRINGPYTWTDFRLSANVAPVKMFSASANFDIGTYGAGFGWMLNYHYTGFGLFLGMDHTLGKLSKEGVPLSSNASVNFGMNVLF